MKLPLLAALLGTTFLLARPATAATWQIDNFSASSTTVTAGSWVDFTVVFSISAFADNVDSLAAEPVPQEGHQTWERSFSRGQNEYLGEVWLAAGEHFYSVDLSGQPPGSTFSDAWSFSIHFPNVGRFETTLWGGWMSQTYIYFNVESGERDCTMVDGGGNSQLSCTPWLFQQSNYSDNYPSESYYPQGAVVINVIASSIPEPLALTQWILGVAGLLVFCLAKRRATSQTRFHPAPASRNSGPSLSPSPAPKLPRPAE